MTESNPSDEPASPSPDVRRTVHEDMGVRVERDMTNSSDWLARGSKTHFSKIKFHSVGRSFAESPVATSDARPAQSAPAISASRDSAYRTVEPAAPSVPPVPSAVPASSGLLDRIKSLFGL